MTGGFDRKLARFETEAQRLLGKTKVDRRDGRRFDFDRGWVQLRSSNTEPIFRLIVETDDEGLSKRLHQAVIKYFS